MHTKQQVPILKSWNSYMPFLLPTSPQNHSRTLLFPQNEESKYTCHKHLTERAACEALQRYCPNQSHQVVEDPLCKLGEWSEWSSCSVTCGKGTMTRDRKYKNRFAAKTCAAGKPNPPILQQNLECFGASKQCENDEEVEVMFQQHLHLFLAITKIYLLIYRWSRTAQIESGASGLHVHPHAALVSKNAT